MTQSFRFQPGFFTLRILYFILYTSYFILFFGCSSDVADDAYITELAWGKEGARKGRFNRPRTVAIAPDGSVYAADMTGRIQYFTHKGEFKGGWRMPDYTNGNARRIRFLRDGTLCVADTHNNRICFFDLEGKLLSQFGEKGAEEGKFMLVSAVAEGPDGTIYTTEYGTTPNQRAEPVDRVQRFSRDGKFLGAWGKTGSAKGEFRRPSGIDIDNSGLVYIADALNHRIQVFSADGSKVERVIGKYGEKPGEFNHPFDVSIGPNGSIFVIEFGGGRVQELTREGKPLAVFGRRGPEKGEFYQPWGITAAAGGLYVADTWNHRIQYIVSKRE